MSCRVSFLVFPDFQILDVTGPMAVFETAGRVCANGIKQTDRQYDLELVSQYGGLIKSSSGIQLQTRRWDEVDEDVLIVSGGLGTRSAIKDKALLECIRTKFKKLNSLCSVCSGSLILAASGVLDGKTATTHWSVAQLFEKYFPKVNLLPDKIYIREDSIWTSAGVTAGIDLALALVSEDWGEEIGRAVAQELVVYYHRPGGQSQFSPLLDLSMKRGRFEELVRWIRENIHLALNVEILAEQEGMSPRNFSRLFKKEMGTTPAKAVERIRIDIARANIEEGRMHFDQIANLVGYSDADHMRRSFVREIGMAPQALRQFAKLNAN